MTDYYGEVREQQLKDNLQRERDDHRDTTDMLVRAVEVIRVLGEETVLAGYPGGDRDQTLANVRAMRHKIVELRQIIADLMACMPETKVPPKLRLVVDKEKPTSSAR